MKPGFYAANFSFEWAKSEDFCSGDLKSLKSSTSKARKNVDLLPFSKKIMS